MENWTLHFLIAPAIAAACGSVPTDDLDRDANQDGAENRVADRRGDSSANGVDGVLALRTNLLG